MAISSIENPHRPIGDSDVFTPIRQAANAAANAVIFA
jgi:hypothetical protein